MNGIIQTKSNDQLDVEEQQGIKLEQDAEAAAAASSGLNQSLMAVLHNYWEDSVRNKVDIETQFFKNLDQVNRVYEKQKLAAIQAIGTDVFIGITESKVRHAKAWVRDALSQKPWAVKPTPSPDVPGDLIAQIQQSFVSQTLQAVQTKAQAVGVPVDMPSAIQEIQATMPELKNKVKAAVKAEVWERCGEMEKEVDDKLVDGGWYEALDATVPDNIVLGTGVLLGPFKRNKKSLVAGASGGVEVQNVVTEEYERASPFQVYPQKNSTGPDNGYVNVKLPYRKLDLQKLIGVPGFDENEIRAVLSEAETGKLRNWTYIETERAIREKKTSESVYDSSIVDCILFMGPLGGKALKEAGIDVPPEKLDFDFLANIWYIGNHYIKAVLNEDPLGRQPISIAHFEENVDGWWGKGLPELIEPEQTVCNACARAIVNNVAMGSGPQVEINVSRLKGGDQGDTRIIPWKRWLTTGQGLQTGPAINFWQPQMHAQEILTVYKEFEHGADSRSNVPAYAHGDSQVGGAGNTASGLSMLITQAARGIRGIIKNIDKMISRSTGFIYERLALDPKYKDKIGDAKLIAIGSQALLEKEQRAVRMLEFLNATNNPIDLQLTGPEGRGYLLGEVAKSHDIDPERAIPRLQALKGQDWAQPAPPPGAPGAGGPPIPNRGTPPVAARNLDQAGNEPQGGTAQLIAGRGGPAAAPPTQ